MLIAAFVPPEPGSLFHESATGMAWYIVPIVGITGPLWGILWYWGLLAYEWKIGRHLVVSKYISETPRALHVAIGDCSRHKLTTLRIVLRQRGLLEAGSRLPRGVYPTRGDHRPCVGTLRPDMSGDFAQSPASAEEVKGSVVTRQWDVDSDDELERGKR